MRRMAAAGNVAAQPFAATGARRREIGVILDIAETQRTGCQRVLAWIGRTRNNATLQIGMAAHVDIESPPCPRQCSSARYRAQTLFYYGSPNNNRREAITRLMLECSEGKDHAAIPRYRFAKKVTECHQL